MHHPTDRIPHTTAFVTPVVEPGRKEENVLFNDALNNFIYGYMERRHMVKDHTDSERKRFPISSKNYSICTDNIALTTAFVTPVVEHWL